MRESGSEGLRGLRVGEVDGDEEDVVEHRGGNGGLAEAAAEDKRVRDPLRSSED